MKIIEHLMNDIHRHYNDMIACGIIHNGLQALVYFLSLKWLPPVTLHSPLLSNGFQRAFTGPSQFQRTHRTACRTSNGIRWTGPNSAPCPVQVQWKSGEVTLKQEIIGLAGLTSPLDFRWTSNGLKGRKWTKCAKCWVRRTSDGLSMDFQWNW
jgi:hypothetical protein